MLDLIQYRSWSARDGADDLRDAWLASNAALRGITRAPIPGTCPACGSEAGFQLAEWNDPADPNPREALLCLHCRLNARVRAAMALIPEGGDQRRIYVTEQVTATYVWMQRNLVGQVLGSEYEPDHERRKALGRILADMGGSGDVQFQDVTRLGFDDASLDVIASFDVLEHVPDYRAAIGEFARTLKPGGRCIATFPFIDRPETVTRARIGADGEVEHLLEPEYHGDPISGGVLCYYHFGWDVLGQFRDAGFSDVSMVMPVSIEHGCHYGLWTLQAIR